MSKRLTEAEWLKLRDYNQIITAHIMPKLPADWYLTSEDVEGAVYDSIISLLSTYKEGAQSPVSYVWQYAEQYTYRDLMREYAKIKKQAPIDETVEDEDGYTVRHEIGKGDVPELAADYRESQEDKDEATQIMERATPEDRAIMEEIMQGYSYEEIAKRHGTDKKAITRRMRKYAKS